MKNENNSGDKTMSHGKRISSVYDTDNLKAIMGRFYSAVSWEKN